MAPRIQEAVERRAHRRRTRLAAFSAASMLALGGAAAGVSMATADEQESGRGGEVVFSGDCGVLGLVSATSSPDSSEVTVEQGSQVRYRNDLGTDAKLHVGDEVYEIGKGATQVFVMNRSAEVAMVPSCAGLFAEYKSAQVNVVEAQSEEAPVEDREDSETDVRTLPAPDSDEGRDSSSSSSTEGGSQSQPDAYDAAGQQGPEGEDGAEAEAEEPDAEETEEVNAFGPPPGQDTDAAADDSAVSDEVVAVDPKAVADGANGLLALVAIICLVGVAAAVARTLLKQRVTA
ncbi:hypothetical protein AB0B28_15460 [Glycomyces sp. NPDC046736]|uniref:hypothetical protein n=1 Tax=Glycomyces sp. NPDC046736 TaxID=3155615 RepID=UPI0033D33446